MDVIQQENLFHYKFGFLYKIDFGRSCNKLLIYVRPTETLNGRLFHED